MSVKIFKLNIVISNNNQLNWDFVTQICEQNFDKINLKAFGFHYGYTHPHTQIFLSLKKIFFAHSKMNV